MAAKAIAHQSWRTSIVTNIGLIINTQCKTQVQCVKKTIKNNAGHRNRNEIMTEQLQ